MTEVTRILDPLDRPLAKGKKATAPDNVVNRPGYDKVFGGFVDLAKVPTPQGDRFVLYTSDSIATIIVVKYADGKRGIVLVRQPRAAVISAADDMGFFVELVAGRLDKEGYTLRQYIMDEASKEAGVTIDPERIKVLNYGQPAALSVGIITESQYYVFCEVDSDDLLEVPEGHWFGDEDESELIQRQVVPLDEFLTRPVQDIKALVAQLYIRLYLAAELTNIG